MSETFTEQAAKQGIEVTGNQAFNELESMVKSGQAQTAGEALAMLLNKEKEDK